MKTHIIKRLIGHCLYQASMSELNKTPGGESKV